MNIFKQIMGWFKGTKPGLWLRIKKLYNEVHSLEEGIEKLEQDLWKERKFKEDYRDRLTRYYDECITLRKKVKKYNSLLKRCSKFKEIYGKSCPTYIATIRRG